MKDEIVCVNLDELFKHRSKYQKNGKVVQTVYDHVIRKETHGNDCYFDLYKEMNSGLRLCCDGEQCKILEQTDVYVKLIDVENIDNEDLEGIDTTFMLSTEEFGIATFLIKEAIV